MTMKHAPPMSGIAAQIPFLIRCLEGTHITLLELTNGEDVISLRPGTRPEMSDPIATSVASESPVALDITAPSLGIFRRAHPWRLAPLAEAGQQLMAGDPVGVLEIGALLIRVVAPKDGTVLDVLVEDGAVVGYGTVLVRFTGHGEQ